jgi:hypothetical protein
MSDRFIIPHTPTFPTTAVQSHTHTGHTCIFSSCRLLHSWPVNMCTMWCCTALSRTRSLSNGPKTVCKRGPCNKYSLGVSPKVFMTWQSVALRLLACDTTTSPTTHDTLLLLQTVPGQAWLHLRQVETCRGGVRWRCWRSCQWKRQRCVRAIINACGQHHNTRNTRDSHWCICCRGDRHPSLWCRFCAWTQGPGYGRHRCDQGKWGKERRVCG